MFLIGVFLLRWNLDNNISQVIVTGENIAVQSIMRYLQMEGGRVLTDEQTTSESKSSPDYFCKPSA